MCSIRVHYILEYGSRLGELSDRQSHIPLISRSPYNLSNGKSLYNAIHQTENIRCSHTHTHTLVVYKQQINQMCMHIAHSHTYIRICSTQIIKANKQTLFPSTQNL